MLIGCITGPDFIAAKRQIAKANLCCDGVELRVDLLSQVEDIGALMALVSGVCILTDPKGDEKLLRFQPDFLTLPWDYPTSISPTRTKIIRSYHNWEKTPHNLEQILAAMPPAAVYKLATMAQSTNDAMRMLCFVKGRPNITGFCMGSQGQISRILGPIVGNVFHYVAIEEEVAPGQLTAQEWLETYNYSQLTPETKIYGLIGNPVSQSPSYRTHNAFFKQQGINALYVRIQVEEKELSLFLSFAKRLGIKGLSVTIPYKEKILPYLHVTEEDAKEIGAVNTLTFSHQKLYGANTDGKGALDVLEQRTLVKGKECVILGAGGSARAIGYEAVKRGAKVTILNRTLEKAKALGEKLNSYYGTLETIPPYDILINATSHLAPLDPRLLQPNTIVMDINFQAQNSPLIKQAHSLGCTVILGEEMFQKQALGQFSRWFEL